MSQAGSFDREKRRAELREELSELLRPAQYVNAFQQHHGDYFADAFKDVNGDLYRQLIDEYETLANDPTARLKYDDKPAALSEWPLPGNVGKKMVDMRLMDDAAMRVRLKRGREAGSREESRRRNRPTVESSSGSQPPAASGDAPLLTADERRFIREHLRELPREWGKTEEAVAQRKWTKLMSPAEKARRQALRDSGRWPS